MIAEDMTDNVTTIPFSRCCIGHGTKGRALAQLLVIYEGGLCQKYISKHAKDGATTFTSACNHHMYFDILGSSMTGQECNSTCKMHSFKESFFNLYYLAMCFGTAEHVNNMSFYLAYKCTSPQMSAVDQRDWWYEDPERQILNILEEDGETFRRYHFAGRTSLCEMTRFACQGEGCKTQIIVQDLPSTLQVVFKLVGKILCDHSAACTPMKVGDLPEETRQLIPERTLDTYRIALVGDYELEFRDANHETGRLFIKEEGLNGMARLFKVTKYHDSTTLNYYCPCGHKTVFLNYDIPRVVTTKGCYHDCPVIKYASFYDPNYQPPAPDPEDEFHFRPPSAHFESLM